MTERVCSHCNERPAAAGDLCRYCYGTRPFWRNAEKAAEPAESAAGGARGGNASKAAEKLEKAAGTEQKPIPPPPPAKRVRKRSPRKRSS